MSEFKELIRRFDKIRSYVRDFYIYGFKHRTEYQQKSSRTYDNERRRLESWFSRYIRSDQSGHKKSVFITLDSGRMAVNPLYQAWKSKTFTNRDITLHFLLLDLLSDRHPHSIEELTDRLQLQFGVLYPPAVPCSWQRSLLFSGNRSLWLYRKHHHGLLESEKYQIPLPQRLPDSYVRG